MQHVAVVGQSVEEVVRVLQYGMQTESEKARRDNTKTAYDPKEAEFDEYCEHRFGRSLPCEADRCLVTPDKVYQFMFYQSLREQRKTGKRVHFQSEEFDNIMAVCGATTNPDDWIKPQKPIGWQQFNTYKAMLKNKHSRQVARRRNNYVWTSEIWNVNCNRLVDLVKSRRAIAAKANFEEKVDSQFSLLKTSDVVPKVEAHMWSVTEYGGYRSLFTELR